MPTVQPKEDTRQPREKKGIRYDRVLMEPGDYEVTKNSTFTIKIPLKKNDKWWVVVEEDDAEVVEEVLFRMWTYDEMVEMRKLSTLYDQMRRVHTIDHDILNRLKIQRFLLSWTFGKNNPRLAIAHSQGVMVDQSWDAVRRLQTNILRYIIERMNERYEYGG